MTPISGSGYRLTIVVPFHKIEGTEQFFLWISQIHDYQTIKVKIVLDSSDSKLIHIFKDWDSSNIQVIVKKVGSPGLARNLALDGLDTEFVMFVDSDDYVYLDRVEKLLNSSPSSDVIVASYEKFDFRTKRVRKFKCPVNTVNFAIEPALWRIIFKTSEISGLQFTKFQMAEDQIFLTSYFRNKKIVYSTGNVIYRYTVNRGDQISNRTSARDELGRAIDYLILNSGLIQSDFGVHIFGKLNSSLGIQGLRRLRSTNYPIKKIFSIFIVTTTRKIRKSFDSDFELLWTIND